MYIYAFLVASSWDLQFANHIFEGIQATTCYDMDIMLAALMMYAAIVFAGSGQTKLLALRSVIFSDVPAVPASVRFVPFVIALISNCICSYPFLSYPVLHSLSAPLVSIPYALASLLLA